MQNRAQKLTTPTSGKSWFKAIGLVVLLVVAGWILRVLFSDPETTTGETIEAPALSSVEAGDEDSAATNGTAYTVSQTPSPPPAVGAPANLMLRGVFASTERELSLAIIANDEGVERYFMLEEAVFDAAILKEIHRYHVVILRNGQRRILRLSRDAEEREPEPSLEVKRGRLLADYRKAILSGDYEKFVGVAGYRPTYRGSSLYGFEIVSQGKKGDAFLNQTGLQHGDIVTSINGHELATDFEYLQSLASNVKTMAEINIGVERAGTILFFSFASDAASGQEQAAQTVPGETMPVEQTGDEPVDNGPPSNTVLEKLLQDDE